MDQDPDPSFMISSNKSSKKNLIPTFLSLVFDFLSLKNYVNVPSKSIKQKNSKKAFPVRYDFAFD